MSILKRKELLFLPFFVGLFLIACSWYSSYPLSVNSVDDFVFNNISILYWFGLPLLLASMYLIAITFKNVYLKWIMVIGILLSIYSIYYFYNALPTSDANYFRGLNEYFAETGNLDYSQPAKTYFQWPSLFLLSNVLTLVTGIELINIEFIMFTVIAIFIATNLFLYASDSYKNSGYIVVVVFFLAMFYYLNFQFAPFTLSFGLLILLIILTNKPLTFGTTVTILILFIYMTITHLYVPIFFVIFTIVSAILNRSKRFSILSLLTVNIFLIYQMTLAQYHFFGNIQKLINRAPSEFNFSSMITIKPTTTLIDSISQSFNTIVLVSTILFCLLGFILILIRRKMRNSDIAIFFVGVIYFGIGTMFYLLGSRAIPVAFIPVSLGAAYLFQSKFKFLWKMLLLILFSFVPLHNAFYNRDVFFQTEETYAGENFFINNYNWTQTDLILASYRVADYFETRLPEITHFDRYLLTIIDNKVVLSEFRVLFYTTGFGWQTRDLNTTIHSIITEGRLNMFYNNGFSIIATKP